MELLKITLLSHRVYFTRYVTDMANGLLSRYYNYLLQFIYCRLSKCFGISDSENLILSSASEIDEKELTSKEFVSAPVFICSKNYNYSK